MHGLTSMCWGALGLLAGDAKFFRLALTVTSPSGKFWFEGYALYVKLVPTSPWLFDRVGAVAYLVQHVPSGNACPGLVHCVAGLPSGEEEVDAT